MVGPFDRETEFDRIRYLILSGADLCSDARSGVSGASPACGVT